MSSHFVETRSLGYGSLWSHIVPRNDRYIYLFYYAIHRFLYYRPQRAHPYTTYLATDHPPSCHHADTLLHHIRRIHRVTHRRGRRRAVHSIPDPWDHPHGSHHQCICECIVIIFLSEVPAITRRAPRRTRAPCYHHRVIHTGLSHTRHTHRSHHLYSLTLLLPTDVRASCACYLHTSSCLDILLALRPYQCPLRQKLRSGEYHPDIFPHATHVSWVSILSTLRSYRNMAYHLSLESSRMDDR